MIKTCHVGVKGVVRVGDKCLVLQKGEGANAYWDIPGGRIDDDETLEETLRRELLEELPSLGKYTVGRIVGAHRLGKNIQDDNGLVLILYRVDTDEFEVELSEEHTSYRWVTKNNLSKLSESGIPIEKGYYDAIVAALD